MGTSTERYHRKKRLRKQQEERQEDTKKKLLELIEKNKKKWFVQIDGLKFNAETFVVQKFSNRFCNCQNHFYILIFAIKNLLFLKKMNGFQSASYFWCFFDSKLHYFITQKFFCKFTGDFCGAFHSFPKAHNATTVCIEMYFVRIISKNTPRTN